MFLQELKNVRSPFTNLLEICNVNIAFQRHIENSNHTLLKNLLLRNENGMFVGLRHVQITDMLNVICVHLKGVIDKLEDYLLNVSGDNIVPLQNQIFYRAPLVENPESVGRKPLDITKEQLEHLRGLDFS